MDREQAMLQRKIARLVAAIGDGQGPAALVQEIRTAEARVQEIAAKRGRLQADPALAELNWQRIGRAIADQLARFADLLKGNVPRAWQLLKKLLLDKVTFTPVRDALGRQTYEFQGTLAYGALLQEVIYSGKVPDRLDAICLILLSSA